MPYLRYFSPNFNQSFKTGPHICFCYSNVRYSGDLSDRRMVCYSDHHLNNGQIVCYSDAICYRASEYQIICPLFRCPINFIGQAAHYCKVRNSNGSLIRMSGIQIHTVLTLSRLVAFRPIFIQNEQQYL